MFFGRTLRTLQLVTALAIAASLPAQQAEVGALSCCEKPPIRPIDKHCLPSGKSPAELPLYRADVAAKYAEIAYVDSFVSLDNCTDTVERQLKDLQAKGRTTGADALIRVRLLKNRVRGWQEDPNTPFYSVRQGDSTDYFFRATAIKYLQPIPPEPETVPITVVQQAGNTQRPALSTNRIFNRGNDRKRYLNDPAVPPAFSNTNTTPGVP